MGIAEQGSTPGRSTLIQGVNTMLEAIGEAPVATLEDDENSEASMAQRKLLEIHRAEQVRGWSWNRSTRIFYRDTSTQEIVVPANIIQFSPDVYTYGRRYTLRGQRVYNAIEGTFEIDIPQIEAGIVECLSWDDSPEMYNNYATQKASLSFGNQVLGSDSQNRFAQFEAQKAWEQLLLVEAREDRPNVLTDGYGALPVPTFHPSFGTGARSGRRYA
jgi:hypothetical protein